ncbi:hypothetical protein [Streptomyces sp. NPDC002490]|uniref:hypothetical protein n=1 Tax=Streptomyces sp. NPDC002490 TaxID=3154416 RepID=UPI00331F53E0
MTSTNPPSGNPYGPPGAGPFQGGGTAGPPPPGWGGPAAVPGEGWGPGAVPEPAPPYREWRSVRELFQRVPGCVSAFVLLVPLGIPMLTSYALVSSARNRAHAVFTHAHRPVDDVPLARVKRLRAVLAVLASSLFLFSYGSQQDYEEVVAGGAARLLVAPWLLVVTAPLLVYLLMRWASEGEYARMRSQLRTPLVTFAQYVGALSTVPLLVFGFSALAEATGDNALLGFLVGLTGVAALLWSLAFAFFASVVVVRSGFGTSGVHQALPALLTTLLVWEFVPIGAALSGLPPGPLPLALLFLLGGPLSVTAVAWWEVHRLTDRHGVVLRA